MCRILEACGKAGVTSLKWGDLEVGFVAGQQQAQTTVTFSPQIPDEPMSEHEPRDKALEEDLSQLMINDPARYEERMMRRDLEHGHNE